MGASKSKPKKSTFEGPVQKRIDQFYAIKNCAEEISKEAILLAEQFYVFEADGNRNHNVALGLSVRCHIHGKHTQNISTQFALFLKSMTDIYDEISREQTIFQKEIHDKVIDPLRSWLQVEFKRMDDEIQKLHMYTYQYEEAKKNIKKNNTGETQLMFELTRRELELQMDVVKSDLGKLRYIKDQHNEHLRNLIKTLESYHEKIARIFEARKNTGSV